MSAGASVSTLRLVAATVALVASAAHTSAQTPVLPVKSIDLYGSDALAWAELRDELEPEVLRYVATMNEARAPNADFTKIEATFRGIQDKVTSVLNARVPLAYVEISVITNSAPPPPHETVTIDVVEKADEGRRMPFRTKPTRDLADPDGLFAAWDELMGHFFDRIRAGRAPPVTAAECPVLHCIVPFTDPEFAPYLDRFNNGAREHEDALYTIAAESRNDNHRANALLVLAPTNNAERLLPVLGAAIYDPSPGVRNNAMRIMFYMAQTDPSRDYPLDALLAAFDFPAASDRNKAGVTLVELAKSPRYRAQIEAEAVPVALRLLRLEQPINHDPAYELLTILSGETFGERDYAAWERWAAAR
jgi:hypothetical protein